LFPIVEFSTKAILFTSFGGINDGDVRMKKQQK